MNINELCLFLPYQSAIFSNHRAVLSLGSCSTGGAFDPPTHHTTNNIIIQCIYNRYNYWYCYELPPVISLVYSYYWQ